MTTSTNYRIITEEGKVKFTGTEIGSWFTLEAAKKLADSSDMIYEYDANGNRLWEVL